MSRAALYALTAIRARALSHRVVVASTRLQAGRGAARRGASVDSASAYNQLPDEDDSIDEI